MKDLYDAKGGRSGVTENRIMRLAFHDCVKYTGKDYENKTTSILLTNKQTDKERISIP